MTRFLGLLALISPSRDPSGCRAQTHSPPPPSAHPRSADKDSSHILTKLGDLSQTCSVILVSHRVTKPRWSFPAHRFFLTTDHEPIALELTKIPSVTWDIHHGPLPQTSSRLDRVSFGDKLNPYTRVIYSVSFQICPGLPCQGPRGLSTYREGRKASPECATRTQFEHTCPSDATGKGRSTSVILRARLPPVGPISLPL